MTSRRAVSPGSALSPPQLSLRSLRISELGIVRRKTFFLLRVQNALHAI